ncbi:MAG: SOS response-associated peptidase [Pseudomonadota bacterium]
MCFFFKQSKTAVELSTRFNAEFDRPDSFSPSNYNGFQFPKTPVITNSEKRKIQLFSWGLIPHWAKDTAIRKHTLNARIETIHEKPSFRDSVFKRCLVLVDGFYEWKWLDAKGKHKQKYLISMPTDEAFAFAGLWSEWIEKDTGEIYKTYTIITKPANALMSEIHNSAKRMPYILMRSNEFNWLNGEQLQDFAVELKTIEV